MVTAFTPSTASSAFCTVPVQWLHIIPSILITFVIVFVLSFSCFTSCLLFCSAGVFSMHCSPSTAACVVSCSVRAASGVPVFSGVNPLLKPLSRRAFPTTKILLKLMAAAPNMGFRRIPKDGYSTPAARGMPMQL